MLLTKILAVSAPIRYRCAEATWEAGSAEDESSSSGSGGLDTERRAIDGALDRMRPTRRVRTRFPGKAFDVGGFLKARGRVRDLYTYALPEPQDLQVPLPSTDELEDNAGNTQQNLLPSPPPLLPPLPQQAAEKQPNQPQPAQRLPSIPLPTPKPAQRAATRPRRTASSAGVPPAWGTFSAEEAGAIVVETFAGDGGGWFGIGRAAPLYLVQFGSVAAPQPQQNMEWAFFVPLDTRQDNQQQEQQQRPRQGSGDGAADGRVNDERMYVYRVLTQGGPEARMRRPCDENGATTEELASVSAQYWVFELQRERVPQRRGGGGGGWRRAPTLFGGDNFCVARRRP
jgi:hypothetical protein